MVKHFKNGSIQYGELCTHDSELCYHRNAGIKPTSSVSAPLSISPNFFTWEVKLHGQKNTP